MALVRRDNRLGWSGHILKRDGICLPRWALARLTVADMSRGRVEVYVPKSIATYAIGQGAPYWTFPALKIESGTKPRSSKRAVERGTEWPTSGCFQNVAHISREDSRRGQAGP